MRACGALPGVQVGGEPRASADRATGECAQLKEKLETARGEYSARINEYMLQVGELGGGASVLSVDPTRARAAPLAALAGGQAMAKDLHRGGARWRVQARDGAAARATGRDAEGPARAARGYRALRHRYEDVAPVVVTEDGEARGGGAQGRDAGARRRPPRRRRDVWSLASKLADLKEENAKLQQALAGRAGRKGTPGARERRRGGGRRVLSGKARRRRRRAQRRNGAILFFDGGAPRGAETPLPSRTAQTPPRFRDPRKPRKPRRTRSTTPAATRTRDFARRMQRLQQAIDSLKKVRPTHVRGGCAPRRTASSRCSWRRLGTWTRRARSSRTSSRRSRRASRKRRRRFWSRRNNARAAFTEQRAAIKGVHRSRAGGAGEGNRTCRRARRWRRSRSRKSTYMAQSTLAYQKEIMRLRSIIQATAPERLRSPRGIGGGGGGGRRRGETWAASAQKSSTASKAGLDAVRAVGDGRRSTRGKAARGPAARHAMHRRWTSG